KLREGIIDRSFTQLMKYEIARARALYDTAIRGIALLPADSRLAVTAAATVYRAILGRIEAADYDVFRQRAHLGAARKVAALPTIWWTSRRMRAERS
ncbi:MAG TPA: squalene/phytoene synthase family protein, partial [Chloroflexia bacterium]|nr:squalene/phytoene synthase family protein [Chloroflexia bacterium]